MITDSEDLHSDTIGATSQKLISFLWRHLWLVISLFIMTLGVAVCVRSNFGSSVISAIPYAFTLAGRIGSAPSLTIGEYTNIMNIILVGGRYWYCAKDSNVFSFSSS